MAATHAQRKALGDYGERLAARYLAEHDLVIVDRNWRCPDGEIDIVAKDGQVLVVCEVKTRSSDRYGTALEAITPEKAARLHRLGRRWAAEHRVRHSCLRVDVVTVSTSGKGVPVVTHFPGLA